MFSDKFCNLLKLNLELKGPGSLMGCSGSVLGLWMVGRLALGFRKSRVQLCNMKKQSSSFGAACGPAVKNFGVSSHVEEVEQHCSSAVECSNSKSVNIRMMFSSCSSSGIWELARINHICLSVWAGRYATIAMAWL